MAEIFSSILKANGFKNRRSRRTDVKEYLKGDDPATCLYAEVYSRSGNWTDCWVVGNGIPDTSYPGGTHVHEPEKLKQLLSAL